VWGRSASGTGLSCSLSDVYFPPILRYRLDAGSSSPPVSYLRTSCRLPKFLAERPFAHPPPEGAQRKAWYQVCCCRHQRAPCTLAVIVSFVFHQILRLQPALPGPASGGNEPSDVHMKTTFGPSQLRGVKVPLIATSSTYGRRHGSRWISSAMMRAMSRGGTSGGETPKKATRDLSKWKLCQNAYAARSKRDPTSRGRPDGLFSVKVTANPKPTLADWQVERKQ
jgi:hypothetical protein